MVKDWEVNKLKWRIWEKWKKIDFGAIPGQRWHIKKRGADGRFSSIGTMDKPPKENDVASHGTGTYLIFTVKPYFKKFNTIIVAPPLNHSKNQKKIKDSRRMISSSNQQCQQSKKVCHESHNTIVHAQVPETSGIPIIKDKIFEDKPSQPAQSQPSYLDVFDEIWKKCHKCAHCKEIIFPKGSEEQCDFCNKFFHNQCLAIHTCSKSVICPSCEKQVLNDSACVMEYCGKQFCSPQCIDICMRKNKWKEKCRTCKGSNEGNKEDTCAHCGAMLDTQSFAFECEDCNILFCSRRCGKEYHLNIEEKHELLRIEFIDEE